MEWYLKVVRDNYANFKGRAQRKEYWMFFLINFLIMTAIGALEKTFGLTTRVGIGLISPIYMLVIFIPSIAVGVRRLHDRNFSGWWLLIQVVPFIFVIIFAIISLSSLTITSASEFSELITLSILIIPVLLGISMLGYLFLIILFVLDSTPGDNRYGPNPKGILAKPITPSPTPPPSITPSV